MPRRHLLAAASLALLMAAGAWTWSGRATATPAELPARLSSEAFAELTDTLSEDGGHFRSDNLVSNELTFQHVIPELRATIPQGGVYVGVGPDQNFTYIAALRPRIAFIVDIRRDNLLMHLMYKALFELADDRAAFLSLLFSRPRPDGLEAGTPAEALFAAFTAVRPDRDQFTTTHAAVVDRLTAHHGLALSTSDARAIERILTAFYTTGPHLSYSSAGGFGGRNYPSFRELQVSTDQAGVNHAYLASAAAFLAVKAMHHNNLIVPVVGDFGGAKALREVGAWIRGHGATVSVFYTSNVEQYLFQSGIWRAFAANVETMPLAEHSTFVRSCFRQCATPYPSISVTLLDSIPELLRDVAAGKVTTYWGVLNHSR